MNLLERITMNSGLRWKFVTAVMAYALVCRVLPWVLSLAGLPVAPSSTWYPWNFSPVAATCVFCAAVVPQRHRTALLLAGLMLGGDFLIDLLTGFRWWTVRNQFVQLWVYACVGIVAACGRQIRSQPGLLTGMPLALLGEAAFFVITNLAMWLSGLLPGQEAPIYPPTFAGLTACYVAALPFFGRSLLSAAIYSGLFFSPWGLGLAGVEPSSTEEADPSLVGARG